MIAARSGPIINRLTVLSLMGSQLPFPSRDSQRPGRGLLVELKPSQAFLAER